MGKRLSLKAIEQLEEQVVDPGEKSAPAVFGICDMDGNPVRRLKLVNGMPVETNEEPAILIAHRLERLLYPKRIKIVYGGRGSTKTRAVVSILSERSRIQKERIICLREIMNSLDESSYQEIVDEVERRALLDEFRFTDGKVRVPRTKSSFSFRGMTRNTTSLKGFANATVAWADEAENISQASWDVLEPTLRKAGSELWITFNPREETDATWKDWVAPYVDKMVDGIYEDDDVLIIECNHIHNPWLTQELKQTRDKMAERDPDRYMWIWEGKFRKSSDLKVLNGKWVIREFEPQKGWSGPYFGADFGFSQDPSTLNKLWIHDERLYVEYEAHGVSIELDHMPDFYDTIPEARKHLISADCARPETISYLRRNGFRIEGAEKWSGSVEDGIAHLRGYKEIVIHPRCRYTIAEANAYQYKEDKNTGLPTTNIIDANNHHWDGIRYGLWRMIKNRNPVMKSTIRFST